LTVTFCECHGNVFNATPSHHQEPEANKSLLLRKRGFRMPVG
jgi:hypothetical protein